jgi:hypothetical protein
MRLTMACSCGSERIFSIFAKCADVFSMEYSGFEYQGYVPDLPGIGQGDDVSPDICADCGRIQNFTPLSDEKLMSLMNIEEPLT